MKARYFRHLPRRGPIGRIAQAVEDDDQIETWMIGQGQEPRGNRQIVVRRAWKTQVHNKGELPGPGSPTRAVWARSPRGPQQCPVR